MHIRKVEERKQHKTKPTERKPSNQRLTGKTDGKSIDMKDKHYGKKLFSDEKLNAGASANIPCGKAFLKRLQYTTWSQHTSSHHFQEQNFIHIWF